MIKISCFLFLALQADPQPTEVERIVAAVSKTYKEYKDLQMPFHQKRYLTMLKNPIQSSGRVFWKSNRLLWRVIRPAKSEDLITDKEILRWIPELDRIEKYDRAQLPLMETLDFGVGQDVEKMLSLYKVAIDPKHKGEASILLLLEPTDKRVRKHIQQIRMWVRKKDHLVFRTEYRDVSGDRTVTDFDVDKIRTNQGLQDNQIKLSAPRGTNVVEPLKPKK